MTTKTGIRAAVVGLLALIGVAGAVATADATLRGATAGAKAAGGGGSTVLDGVYRVSVTPADLRAIGTPESDIAANHGTTTMILDRGRFAFTQRQGQGRLSCTWGYGTLAVTSHRVALTFKDGGGRSPTGGFNRPGEHFVYGWKRVDGGVALSAVPGQVSPEPLRAVSWRRLSVAPVRSSLDHNCLPPAKALS
jgi:hypothetical protein